MKKIVTLCILLKEDNSKVNYMNYVFKKHKYIKFFPAIYWKTNIQKAIDLFLEYDLKLQTAYSEVVKELGEMKKQKGWSAAMLAEMYWFSDTTFEDLAKQIKISKSTAFLNVRKVKEKLRDKLDNPFDKDTDE